jgi:gas vesicle protein
MMLGEGQARPSGGVTTPQCRERSPAKGFFMARNKGRRPPDASRATPDSRPPAAGEGAPPPAAPTSNGSASISAASSPTVAGTAAGAAGAAPAAPGAAAAAPGGPAASRASAAGSPPERPTAPPPPAGAQAGRPSPPPPGSGGPGGRPPGPSGGRTPPAAAPRDGSHRSFRNGLIGGVIGGALVALAVVYFLRPDDSAELQALRSQLEQVESSVAGLENGTDAVTTLTSRIDALEQAAPPEIGELQARLDALQQSSPAALNEELQARLQALEQSGPGLAQRLDQLESSSGAGAPDPETSQRLDQLQEELARLSANVAAQTLEGDAAASDVAVLQTLQSRVDALESSMAQADSGAALAGLEERLAKLEQSQPDPAAAQQVSASLNQLADRVDTLEPLARQSAGNQEALGGLESQLGGLDQQIKGLSERADAAQAEIGTLSARVTGLDAKVTAAADGREQGALLALAASQIDSAIGLAQPYETPLQSLSGLAADDSEVQAAVEALRPAAAQGVPSVAELRRQFEEVAAEIVHQSRAPEGQSLLDQATGNLMRLVSVRPVGADVEGDDPPARVARAEAALAKGDLAAAVAEVEALQGPAAAAAADWLAAARTRLAATSALERLRSRATARLSQGG